MTNNILLLDCTLRDGGYVNNWEFDYKAVREISEGLQRAGVDFVELGILGKVQRDRERTKFNNFKEIEPLLAEHPKDCLYTIILNYSEKDDFEIPERSERTVDCIRLAYFEVDWRDALEYGRHLKEKGYVVFLQAMATALYTEAELKEMLAAVNELRPYSFYIVDSFGTLYNQGVLRLIRLADAHLESSIVLGFHAHNNIQMAFSNSVAFISNQTKRTLITDACIYGMGRGAGNLTTELIMQYLNQTFKANYKIEEVLKLFDLHIREIFEKYYWGYSMEYFMTASKNINSAYAWYLNNKKDVASLTDLNDILNLIPQEFTFSLFPNIADKAKEQCEDAKNKQL